MFSNRTYRNFLKTETVAYQITLGESDLFIRTDSDLSEKATQYLKEVREILVSYIKKEPEFAASFTPITARPDADSVIQKMIAAGELTEVGPMAAVAGMVSEYVGQKLGQHSKQVIVENGGDLYLKINKDLVVGIYAGGSPLSGKIGLKLKASNSPLALCTSSGTVGHSFSYGIADAVSILSKNTALADAAATSIGNKIKSKSDLNAAIEYSKTIPGVEGICIIIEDALGIWGNLELTKLTK